MLPALELEPMSALVEAVLLQMVQEPLREAPAFAKDFTWVRKSRNSATDAEMRKRLCRRKSSGSSSSELGIRRGPSAKNQSPGLPQAASC